MASEIPKDTCDGSSNYSMESHSNRLIATDVNAQSTTFLLLRGAFEVPLR